jgi:hypothetical protein
LSSQGTQLAIDERNAVTNVIALTFSQLCLETFKDQLRAIVITGSMARDEATLVQEGGEWNVVGDAEFLLIFQEHGTVPGEKEMDAIGKSVEEELRAQQIICSISLSAAKAVYLRGLPPHIFGYELRECGRVVWGEPFILSLIPSFAAADIPLEDGWRLLSNRIVEHIELARGLKQDTQDLPPFLQYQTIKLCLDTATSFLLFAGAYAPTYAERQKALEHILEDPQKREQFSFLPDAFADRVSVCTRLKLGETEPEGDLNFGWRFWESVVASACAVWKWELSILTGLPVGADFQELSRSSLHAQNARQKARGWLLVFREMGWTRSWRQWPNWIGKVWRGSPRQRVYLAAFELFSRLDRLIRSGSANSELDAHWADVRDSLPLAGRHLADSLPDDWRQLASEIALNYHMFVEKTRA